MGDALNRLTQGTGNFGPNQSLVTHNYRYDAIGNIREKAGFLYSYTNAAHPSAVTSTSDGTSYTYDANGNMLTAGAASLTWDADNRASTLSDPRGTVIMTYDYTGIRVKKASPLGTTLYPFSGYEIDPNGVIIKYIKVGIETVAAKKSTGQKRCHSGDCGGLAGFL